MRAFPIVRLIQEAAKHQQQRHYEAQQQASKWSDERQRLTDHANKKNGDGRTEASKRLESSVEATHPIHQANVSLDNDIKEYIEVWVDVENHAGAIHQK